MNNPNNQQQRQIQPSASQPTLGFRIQGVSPTRINPNCRNLRIIITPHFDCNSPRLVTHQVGISRHGEQTQSFRSANVNNWRVENGILILLITITTNNVGYYDVGVKLSYNGVSGYHIYRRAFQFSIPPTRTSRRYGDVPDFLSVREYLSRRNKPMLEVRGPNNVVHRYNRVQTRVLGSGTDTRTEVTFRCVCRLHLKCEIAFKKITNSRGTSVFKTNGKSHHGECRGEILPHPLRQHEQEGEDDPDEVDDFDDDDDTLNPDRIDQIIEEDLEPLEPNSPPSFVTNLGDAFTQQPRPPPRVHVTQTLHQFFRGYIQLEGFYCHHVRPYVMQSNSRYGTAEVVYPLTLRGTATIQILLIDERGNRNSPEIMNTESETACCKITFRIGDHCGLHGIVGIHIRFRCSHERTSAMFRCSREGAFRYLPEESPLPPTRRNPPHPLPIIRRQQQQEQQVQSPRPRPPPRPNPMMMMRDTGFGNDNVVRQMDERPANQPNQVIRQPPRVVPVHIHHQHNNNIGTPINNRNPMGRPEIFNRNFGRLPISLIEPNRGLTGIQNWCWIFITLTRQEYMIRFQDPSCFVNVLFDGERGGIHERDPFHVWIAKNKGRTNFEIPNDVQFVFLASPPVREEPGLVDVDLMVSHLTYHRQNGYEYVRLNDPKEGDGRKPVRQDRADSMDEKDTFDEDETMDGFQEKSQNPDLDGFYDFYQTGDYELGDDCFNFAMLEDPTLMTQDMVDFAGANPLFYAVGRGDLGLVKHFVEKKFFSIYRPDHFGYTCFDVAEILGQTEILDYFRAHQEVSRRAFNMLSKPSLIIKVEGKENEEEEKEGEEEEEVSTTNEEGRGGPGHPILPSFGPPSPGPVTGEVMMGGITMILGEEKGEDVVVDNIVFEPPSPDKISEEDDEVDPKKTDPKLFKKQEEEDVDNKNIIKDKQNDDIDNILPNPRNLKREIHQRKKVVVKEEEEGEEESSEDEIGMTEYLDESFKEEHEGEIDDDIFEETKLKSNLLPGAILKLGTVLVRLTTDRYNYRRFSTRDEFMLSIELKSRGFVLLFVSNNDRLEVPFHDLSLFSKDNPPVFDPNRLEITLPTRREENVLKFRFLDNRYYPEFYYKTSQICGILCRIAPEPLDLFDEDVNEMNETKKKGLIQNIWNKVTDYINHLIHGSTKQQEIRHHLPLERPRYRSYVPQSFDETEENLMNLESVQRKLMKYLTIRDDDDENYNYQQQEQQSNVISEAELRSMLRSNKYRGLWNRQHLELDLMSMFVSRNRFNEYIEEGLQKEFQHKLNKTKYSSSSSSKKSMNQKRRRRDRFKKVLMEFNEEKKIELQCIDYDTMVRCFRLDLLDLIPPQYKEFVHDRTLFDNDPNRLRKIRDHFIAMMEETNQSGGYYTLCVKKVLSVLRKTHFSGIGKRRKLKKKDRSLFTKYRPLESFEIGKEHHSLYLSNIRLDWMDYGFVRISGSWVDNDQFHEICALGVDCPTCFDQELFLKMIRTLATSIILYNRNGEFRNMKNDDHMKKKKKKDDDDDDVIKRIVVMERRQKTSLEFVNDFLEVMHATPSYPICHEYFTKLASEVTAVSKVLMEKEENEQSLLRMYDRCAKMEVHVLKELDYDPEGWNDVKREFPELLEEKDILLDTHEKVIKLYRILNLRIKLFRSRHHDVWELLKGHCRAFHMKYPKKYKPTLNCFLNKREVAWMKAQGVT